MRTRYLALLLILGALAAQCVYYFPLLPELVASHFGAGGRPNGWISRTGFLVFYLIMIAILASAMFLLPLLLRHLRTTAINIPNREYWLLPEHRGQAYEMLINEMAWFGNAILLFMVCVMQLVFEANTRSGQRPALDEGRFLTLLSLFFAFVIFWIVRLYRRFAVPVSGGVDSPLS
jgi:uncharacterized membrane protein